MADQRTDKEVAADKAAAARAEDDGPVIVEGTGLVAVTFHEMYAPYNAGETAGVDRNLAERLVKAGKARYHRAVTHEDRRPAFDGDQPVDQAVAPNHPMRSPSQLAEQQIKPTPAESTGTLDTSSGRDMTGTTVKPSHHDKGKR